MTEHLLTEKDCDALRHAMQERAIQTTGTPACRIWQEAVELLDQSRSDSFLHRACIKAGLQEVLPAPRRTLGLRYTR